MSTALKDRYSKAYLENLAGQLKKHSKGFDSKNFLASVFDQNWDERSLKERMAHISVCIEKALPGKYRQQCEILVELSPEFGGFEGMFIPHFVESYGLDDWDMSVKILEYCTEYASSEFAVRQFILKDRDKMMAQMKQWSKHENHHVRRLSTEGCRPRLPWACALPEFKKEPRFVLPIIDGLKNDESLYVRRSVANNINDISKDNPELVMDLIRLWQGQSKEQDWILKHGARTLLKKSDKTTLGLFGNKTPKHVKLQSFICQEQSEIGKSIQFEFQLESEKPLGKLRIEYKIGFIKASGKMSYKIFKISEGDYDQNKLSYSKEHALKQLSTRKHYPGTHTLALIVNGVKLSEKEFKLKKEA